MKLLYLGFVLVCVGLFSPIARAFDVNTHTSMNDSAVVSTAPDGFLLHNFLAQELGLVAGIGTPLAGLNPRLWIDLGGGLEDDPIPYPVGLDSLVPGRFNRHFHDPLVSSWADAGLHTYLFEVVPLPIHFLSSVQWMQLDDGVDAGTVDLNGQGWSWPDARRAYYDALTMKLRPDRDQKWADTLRAVGEIMHLVEDTASPAHVRNDPHGMATLFERWGWFRNFESHVEEKLGSGEFSLDPAMASPRFNRNILHGQTGHDEARAPVARLIDTDGYNGSDSNLTWPTQTIGLAEFTNANFYSEDTVPFFGIGNYSFPSVTGLVPVTYPVASGYNRHYFAKGAGDGIPVNPVMVGSAWDIAFAGDPGVQFAIGGTTDDNVWGAMAPILVPKAVDYAQGALEYFFRGRIDFTRDPDNPGQYLIKNLSPAGMPTMQAEDLMGTFKLYAEDQDGTRTLSNGNTWEPQGGVPAGGQVSVSTFAASDTAHQYVLAFDGTMGEEKRNEPAGALGAVAGKVIPASRWLIMAFSSTYEAAQPANGWHRLTSGPLQQDFTSGTNFYRFHQASFVSNKLFFVNLGYVDHGDYGIGLPVWQSTDGGQSFTDISTTYANADGTGIFLGSVTWLGGTELLATYYQKSADNWGYPYIDLSLPGGLLYSADLGQNWEGRGLAIYPATTAGLGVMYVGRNGNNDPVVLMVGAADAGLMASTDGGHNWTEIAGADAAAGATSIAWNQVDGSGSVILAVDGYGKSLLRSVDQGQTWTTVRVEPTLRYSYTVDGFGAYSSGDWVASVAISPQNEVLMTVEHYFYIWGDLPRNAWSQMLYRSTDAGDTWQLVTDPRHSNSDPTGPPDPHDIAWDPSGNGVPGITYFPGQQAVGVAYLGNANSIP